MRSYHCIWIGIIFLNTLIPKIVNGQVPETNSDKVLTTDIIEERVVLTADRTVYVVGEKIQFKAVYLTSANMGRVVWSEVLYLELITPDGNPLSQHKFQFAENESSGSIQIPDNLLSGIYYLKGYTKWMRNFPVSNYAYYQIKLINPYDSSILAIHTGTGESQISFNPVRRINDHVEISTDTHKYGTRQKVDVNLKFNPINNQEFSYAVSVVRKGSQNLSAFNLGRNEQTARPHEVASYYPEINGISLSGMVINPADKSPVQEATVSLSLLNQLSFFSAVNTNPTGKFFFTLPNLFNAHDFYIYAEKDGSNLDVRIDNDFCQRSLHINTPKFKLSDEEKKLATDLAINAQINSRYSEYGNHEVLTDTVGFQQSFYGKPDKVYYTGTYIELPDIEEFLFELVPEIKVTYSEGKPTIQSSQWNVYHNLPFLVLIDNIPVSDINTFIDIKINAIESIELVNHSYVIGNSKYNGIISVFSKSHDIAGIDLPENSLFFSYQMYSSQKEVHITELSGPRIPDRRNCLYWNANLIGSKENSSNLSFTTADVTGDYQIIIHCISKQNGLVSYAISDLTVE